MWNRWPGQVWCMKQSTQSWYSRRTQRDGVGREVGGGSGIGGPCAPVADPCQCVAGATTVLWCDCPLIKISKLKKKSSQKKVAVDGKINISFDLKQLCWLIRFLILFFASNILSTPPISLKKKKICERAPGVHQDISMFLAHFIYYFTANESSGSPASFCKN